MSRTPVTAIDVLLAERRADGRRSKFIEIPSRRTTATTRPGNSGSLQNIIETAASRSGRESAGGPPGLAHPLPYPALLRWRTPLCRNLLRLPRAEQTPCGRHRWARSSCLRPRLWPSPRSSSPLSWPQAGRSSGRVFTISTPVNSTGVSELPRREDIVETRVRATPFVWSQPRTITSTEPLKPARGTKAQPIRIGKKQGRRRGDRSDRKPGCAVG